VILFSEKGARVVLVGRRLEKLKETLRELPASDALLVQADVSKLMDARRIVEETLREFGRLDILVNNAGVGSSNLKVPDLSEEEWDRVIDVNLKGVFLCSKFAIPAMKRNGGGVITNVSSNWGIVGAENSSSYCASKAGVIALTKCLAIDHAEDGIVVNCICPGDVDTPMMWNDPSSFLSKSLRKQENQEEIKRHLSKVISPEEIAHAILYLVSDQAAMSTGTMFVIDNGATSSQGPPLLSSRKTRRRIPPELRRDIRNHDSSR
jgi:NAD(P)-dependent dehydrogenase (short-subunit alcohol dehydrogenase family)